MSETGAEGTQPWLNSGAAPDAQLDGDVEGPRPTEPDPATEDPTVATPARRRPEPGPPPADPAAEDPTVATPARHRPEPGPPQPRPGARTPRPDRPPADPATAASVWQHRQHPPAVEQQRAAYQQPPAYDPGLYGQPRPQHVQQPGWPGDPAWRPAVRSKRAPPKGLLIAAGGAVAAVVLVVLIAGFLAPGFFKTRTLNVDAAQAGVQQVLSDKTTGYGATSVDSVKCNNGENPTVQKGATFTCEVRIDGANRQVTATFVDDDGFYEVGPPK